MVYDPQRDRPRLRSNGHRASIDSLLDPVDNPPQPDEDPLATSAHAENPGADPGPGDGWTERLLYSVGMSTVLGTAAGLVALRLGWKLWRRRTR